MGRFGANNAAGLGPNRPVSSPDVAKNTAGTAASGIAVRIHLPTARKERLKETFPAQDSYAFCSFVGMLGANEEDWAGEGVMAATSLASVVSREAEVPDVIDDGHLRRMTLGDRRLEREVLEIFVRQIAIMLTRITVAEPALASAAAHTLMGSARGIGAWRVAEAAERLERAAAARIAARIDDGAMNKAVEELKAMAVEASVTIDARLAASLGGASCLASTSRDH